ncbi:MAG: YezD family protein [Terrimicrobiaceae bacterium]|jgi:hypothetical protein
MPAQTAVHPSSSEEIITNPHSQNWFKLVEQQIAALKFGSVVITVHEGRVVQIETSVKVRFEKPH